MSKRIPYEPLREAKPQPERALLGLATEAHPHHPQSNEDEIMDRWEAVPQDVKDELLAYHTASRGYHARNCRTGEAHQFLATAQ